MPGRCQRIVLKNAPTWERRFSKRLLPARKPALPAPPNFNTKWYIAGAPAPHLFSRPFICGAGLRAPSH